jgi:hypothetical protein
MREFVAEARRDGGEAIAFGTRASDDFTHVIAPEDAKLLLVPCTEADTRLPGCSLSAGTYFQTRLVTHEMEGLGRSSLGGMDSGHSPVSNERSTSDSGGRSA